MVKRLPKPFYYLSVAETISKRSTCITKQWGCCIVNHDRIVSTGYNGSPSGVINCCDIERCMRRQKKEEQGDKYVRGGDYDLCVSVHAEQNAMIAAPRELMIGATMYIYGYDILTERMVKDPAPCTYCKRMIINAGIRQVVIADPVAGIPCDGVTYRARTVNVQDWIDDVDEITKRY